jgi:hypothetical protein
MASLKSFALLIVVLGLVSSINMTDYLYPSETAATVSYNNFTLDSVQYSIVQVDGVNTFVLKGNDIITDQSEIKSTLQSYYASNYLPSKEELEELQSLVDSYNESRNNGQKFKGKEETVCQSVLFIDGHIKDSSQKPIYCRNESDNASCVLASKMMYQYLSSVNGPPVSSPNDLLAPIKLFGFADYGTDVILAQYDARLEAAEKDPAQVSDTLSYIKNTVPNLSIYKNQMEDFLFTFNKNKTTDSQHWGLCPDIDLNDSALDQVNALVANLTAKIAPYDNRDSVSAQIAGNTAARLDYLKNDNMLKYYSNLFSPLNSSGDVAIKLARSTLAHVSSPLLSAKLEQLTALQSTIPEDISNKNFTTLDADLSEYKNLTIDVNVLSQSAISSYDAAKNAKNSANSVLLILQTKDSDPVTMKALGLLINETEDINAKFRDGLTVAELDAVSSNYSSIEERAKPLLDGERQMPATKVLLMFRGFARKVNTGLANVAIKTNVISPQDIPKGVVPLGAFSALVLISFASIALLFFLYIFSSFRFTVPKTGHILGAAFLCAMMALLGFTIFMYLFLGKTSTDANLQEFLADFNSRNNTSIFVDVSNISLSDSKAMQSCASVLADSMAKRNKTWTLYTMNSGNCIKTSQSGANTSLTVDECMNLSSNAPSSFVLSYSDKNQVPKFAIIYQSKAQINGNQDYYDSCPIVSLFS